MKFFHISDLHFGKLFFDISLTETDQKFWTERFLEAVDKYNPDAVIIAGDIYDRKVPSAEAMHLFDTLITYSIMIGAVEGSIISTSPILISFVTIFSFSC